MQTPSDPNNNSLPQRKPLDPRRREARDALLGINKKPALTNAIKTAVTKQSQSLSPEEHAKAQAALSGKELPRRRPRRGSRGSKKKKREKRRQLALVAGKPRKPTTEKIPEPTIEQIPEPVPLPKQLQPIKKKTVPTPQQTEQIPPIQPPTPPATKTGWDSVPPKKKSRLLSRVITTFIVILFALGAGAGIGAGYYYFKTGNIISFSSEKETRQEPTDTDSLSRQDIIDYVENLQSSDIASGTTKEIELISNGTKLDMQDFLSIFDVSASEELIQSLGDEFIIGIYGGEFNAPFLALEVTNFARSYASMSAWEKTLQEDIGELFTVEQGIEFKTHAIGTVDARILVTEENAPIITYAFVSRTGLIITTTPEVLEGIVRSYQTQ